MTRRLKKLFKDAFASRTCPLFIVEKMGIQHVKGILLYSNIRQRTLHDRMCTARRIENELYKCDQLNMLNEVKILNLYHMEGRNSTIVEQNGAKYTNMRSLLLNIGFDRSTFHIIILDIEHIYSQYESTIDEFGDKMEEMGNVTFICMTRDCSDVDMRLLYNGRFEIRMDTDLILL